MRNKRVGQPNIDITTSIMYDEEEMCLLLETEGDVVKGGQADHLNQVVEHLKGVRLLAGDMTDEHFGPALISGRALQVILRWIEEKNWDLESEEGD